MPLKHPRPWKITNTGSAFKISDREGRALAYVYYRDESALLHEYLSPDEARAMAKAIARLSLRGASEE